MAAKNQAAPAAAQIGFTRSFLNQAAPHPTPAGTGSTRPADGQMYPRSK